MSPERRLGLWLLVLLGAGALIYLLRGALLPFVAGMAVGYLLDPLADRLEALKCPRGVAAAIILGAFFAGIIAILVVLVPILQAQVAGFIARVPAYAESLQALAKPIIAQFKAQLTEAQMAQLRETAGGYAGNVVGWLGSLVGGLFSGGVAVLNVVSLIVIMPVVAFYLLRDWDRIITALDALLPREAAETIREQFREIDMRLSGFVRGQTIVCLVLGTWYAVGLSLVGLDFGLLVGLGAGLISFIPYFGTAVGLGVGLSLAVAQYGEWLPIALVAAVFFSGQALEGFVLTPNLVGERVGLHPVWVLFALMAGGGLMGFTGVVLAVPAAAALGVIVRFGKERYLQSALYRGAESDANREIGGAGARGEP
jgi:predicted PurR-regulated permease PerM